MEKKRKHSNNQITDRKQGSRIESKLCAVYESETRKHIADKRRNSYFVKLFLNNKDGHRSQQNSNNDCSRLHSRHTVPHHPGILNHLRHFRIIPRCTIRQYFRTVSRKTGYSRNLSVQVIRNRRKHGDCDSRIMLYRAIFESLRHHNNRTPEEGYRTDRRWNHVAQKCEQSKNSG